MRYTAGLIALTSLSLGTVASAQDLGFSYGLELELGASSVTSAPTAAEELTDVYASATAELNYNFGNGFSAFAEVTFESVTDPVDNRAFEDMGLYIGALGVTYATDKFSVTAGKFAPAFGMAWDEAPGFYGADFAEDYELGEALGASVEYAIAGDHTLTASVFYADTTALSDSWGTKRGRTTLAAGGAGNTEKFNNFALQLSGSFGETSYNLSARKLSAGLGDVSDETGVSLGLAHTLDFAGNELTVMTEFARFSGFGGTADDVTYATFGAAYGFGNYTLNAAYTARNGVGGLNDKLGSFGVDYDFGNDLTASVGYAQMLSAGGSYRALGLSLVKEF